MADKAIEVEGENSIKEISKKAVEEPTPIKKITDLTDEEKKQIIDNLKAGKENEHYELKEFKNGSSRIVKKDSIIR